MRIRNCKINHIKNPLGFAMPAVTASWVTESGNSIRQVWARIRVALDEAMEVVVLDTGEADLDSRATRLPLRLAPYTRYFWQVSVRGNQGELASSEINWFETGKMSAGWQGKWITPPWEDKDRHPVLEKCFTLRKEELGTGRIYAAGLGLYEMELNGIRVGREYFAPGCTACDAWIQIYTYDISDFLREGKNVLHVLMGNGWAKGRYGSFKNMSPYTDVFSFLADIRIVCRDGKVLEYGTDDSWTVMDSPIVSDGIYDGEVLDMTRTTGMREYVRLFDPSHLGRLEDRRSLPVEVREIRSPAAILRTPEGDLVLDMGQNMTGWIRMRVHEPAGTKVGYCCCETLQKGNFYRDNLGNAKAEYWVIADGTDRMVEPHFTYFGFRYAKLVGFTKEPMLEDFYGCVVYSGLERTGEIRTDDARVNRLFENVLWSQKSNFLDVPTDCPQRSERMGWTGDAQVFCRTASFNMDTYAFYGKYLHDVYAEQKMDDGMVGCIVPSLRKEKGGESGFFRGGSSVWGDCATIIPWTLYLHYGDRAILEEQYASMKDWVEWIYRQDMKNGGIRLRTTGFHYGDWLALDGTDGIHGGTENAYIATVYYLYSSEILARAAAVLEKREDEDRYGRLAEEIRRAIREEYFSASGRCVLHTQTAYLLALRFHLAPRGKETAVRKALEEQIIADGKSLKTGFVGTPFLCPMLSESGNSGLAYDLFLRREYPGWLYEVELGSTTIWERWNSLLADGTISTAGMNSLNHYAYGSIAEWMYQYMAGIQPLEDSPGFLRFAVRPQIDSRIGQMEAAYDSAMGLIRSGWSCTQDGWCEVRVTVPFGSECILTLPVGYGQKIDGAGELEESRGADGDTIIHLTAGEYSFHFLHWNLGAEAPEDTGGF